MLVLDALNKFGKDVQAGAKLQLRQQNKNTSKQLSKSVKFETKVSKNSFKLSFFMEDYGKFVDQGVKGIGGSRADGTPYKKKKVDASSPFKYKKGIENKPSRKHFDKWSVQKGIAGRNKKGQFLTRIGLTSAISQIVWHEGLKTTNFFTKPFEKEFKELPDELTEAYGLDVENLLKFSLK